MTTTRELLAKIGNPQPKETKSTRSILAKYSDVPVPSRQKKSPIALALNSPVNNSPVPQAPPEKSLPAKIGSIAEPILASLGRIYSGAHNVIETGLREKKEVETVEIKEGVSPLQNFYQGEKTPMAKSFFEGFMGEGELKEWEKENWWGKIKGLASAVTHYQRPEDYVDYKNSIKLILPKKISPELAEKIGTDTTLNKNGITGSLGTLALTSLGMGNIGGAALLGIGTALSHWLLPEEINAPYDSEGNLTESFVDTLNLGLELVEPEIPGADIVPRTTGKVAGKIGSYVKGQSKLLQRLTDSLPSKAKNIFQKASMQTDDINRTVIPEIKQNIDRASLAIMDELSAVSPEDAKKLVGELLTKKSSDIVWEGIPTQTRKIVEDLRALRDGQAALLKETMQEGITRIKNSNLPAKVKADALDRLEKNIQDFSTEHTRTYYAAFADPDGYNLFKKTLQQEQNPSWLRKTREKLSEGKITGKIVSPPLKTTDFALATNKISDLKNYVGEDFAQEFSKFREEASQAGLDVPRTLPEMAQDLFDGKPVIKEELKEIFAGSPIVKKEFRLKDELFKPKKDLSPKFKAMAAQLDETTSFARTLQDTSQALIARETLDRLARIDGVAYKAIPEGQEHLFRKIPDLASDNGWMYGELAGKYVRKSVADQILGVKLNKASEVMSKLREKTLEKVFKKVTGISYNQVLTTARPRFLIKQTLENLFSHVIGDVKIKDRFEAWSWLKKNNAGKKIPDEIKGKLEWFLENGGGEAPVTKVINEGQELLEIYPKGKGKKLLSNLVSTLEDGVEFVDTADKFAVFHSYTKRGMTFNKALEETKRLMFYYDEYQAWERQIQPFLLFAKFRTEAAKKAFDFFFNKQNRIRKIDRFQANLITALAAEADREQYDALFGESYKKTQSLTPFPITRRNPVTGKLETLNIAITPFNFFSDASSILKNPTSAVLSSFNPLLRSLYTVMTGTDPFSGRNYGEGLSEEGVKTIPLFLGHYVKQFSTDLPAFEDFFDYLTIVNEDFGKAARERFGDLPFIREVTREAFPKLRDSRQAALKQMGITSNYVNPGKLQDERRSDILREMKNLQKVISGTAFPIEKRAPDGSLTASQRREARKAKEKMQELERELKEISGIEIQKIEPPEEEQEKEYTPLQLYMLKQQGG